MKKSELYKFIREEVEVVLTNEEAVEIFDLDLGVLLDEMMGRSDTRKSCSAQGLSWDSLQLRCGAPQASLEEIEDLEEKKLTSKERKDMSGSDFIFPDGKHFPIPDESHGRNALARANQFSSAPKWYKGSLQSFVSRVHNAVKKKFPGIDTTEKSEKPGKG